MARNDIAAHIAQKAANERALAAHIAATEALEAFIAKKAEIDTMLARLTALSADHFNREPDSINWGDVGSLTHYAARLREITDAAFSEGEHAA